jgi:hypothetical protein
MKRGDSVFSPRYPELGVGIIEREWEAGGGFFIVIFADQPHQVNVLHQSGLCPA